MRFGLWLLGATVIGSHAAELSLGFSPSATGEVPAGYRPMLAGEGRPGRWEVVQTAVPSLLEPLSPQALQTATKAVLTQTDLDPTDERFPMLVYEGEVFGDFSLKMRFRILGGEREQMAGIAFRLQDARNFYVLRASALGRNVRFYKVADGQRSRLLGPSIEVSTNTWHELGVKCTGNEIICLFNGEPILPPLQDASFPKGKIAFWTKSDAHCQFEGAQIEYTPIIPLSQRALAAALERYPRVRNLKLYVLDEAGAATRVVAAKDPADMGAPGESAEKIAIQSGEILVGRGKGEITVVMPVRDRNGDPVAAARIVLDSFPGQTDDNAVVRARPVVQVMERLVAPSLEPFR